MSFFTWPQVVPANSDWKAWGHLQISGVLFCPRQCSDPSLAPSLPWTPGLPPRLWKMLALSDIPLPTAHLGDLLRREAGLPCLWGIAVLHRLMSTFECCCFMCCAWFLGGVSGQSVNRASPLSSRWTRKSRWLMCKCRSIRTRRPAALSLRRRTGLLSPVEEFVCAPKGRWSGLSCFS